MELTRIGLWTQQSGDGLPAPESLVDSNRPLDEHTLVADYLERGFVCRAYLGRATCRLCGTDLGSLELTDGSFAWPEGLPHYLRAHGVALPEEFIRYVLQRVDALEEASGQVRWWIERTSSSPVDHP
ncbi:hypothetical protein [Frondihabitans australicus]|uniref:Uncharacterized protein n=1 Tax=Frondihabitans australicus TaxID=386892 RepID=A0A495IM92_9MICO|nr:hypothetical protein [Frondihabitans australicus]RKR76381.1 hypothetical protein C8E83_3554 [Frondihabitans australicus]